MITYTNTLKLNFSSRKPYIDIILKIIENLNSVIRKVNFINDQIEGKQDNEATEDFFGFGISLSIDEAIKNAIEHGNKSDYSKPVEIWYTVNQQQIKVVIKDAGRGFNYRILPTDVDTDEETGRGILLMKNFMDEVIFNETGNEVTLIKKLNSTDQEDADEH